LTEKPYGKEKKKLGAESPTINWLRKAGGRLHKGGESSTSSEGDRKGGGRPSRGEIVNFNPGKEDNLLFKRSWREGFIRKRLEG